MCPPPHLNTNHSSPLPIVGKVTTSREAVVEINKIGAELVMRDSGGNAVWSVALGGDRVHAIALGAHGQNSLLATGTSGNNAFLRKYSNDGSVLWTRTVLPPYACLWSRRVCHRRPDANYDNNMLMAKLIR